MKSTTQLPRIGRPVAAPTASDWKRFGPLALLVDDTIKILKKCGAPSGATKLSKQERGDRIAQSRPLPVEKSWSDQEAVLILRCLHAPLLLASSENDPAHLRSIPLSFARLFAEAPDAMTEALPKIKRLLLKRARTPKQAVAFDYALRRDERFWTEKSDLLAGELRQMLRLPITAKIVEHARAMLRKQSSTFPRNGS